MDTFRGIVAFMERDGAETFPYHQAPELDLPVLWS